MINKAPDQPGDRALRNLGMIDRRKFAQRLGIGSLSALLPASLGTFASGLAEGPAGRRQFPTPTNINHLSCTVADYARSRDFYMGLFGMRLTWDDGRQCALEFGNPAAPNGIYIRPLSKSTDKPDVGHIAFGIPDFMKYKAAIKREMDRYHLTGIRTDGEVGWTCNDPTGYMLNILIERDKSVFPGAAAPCEIAVSDKCEQAYEVGKKNINATAKPNGSGFKALYFSHVTINVPEGHFTSEIDFYRDVMGMKVIYENRTDNPEAFLRFGQNTLHLQKSAKTGDKAYCNHFAFVIESWHGLSRIRMASK